MAINRIILIGNGFDLAHGLKTKYEHFINDFWERAFEDYTTNRDKDTSVGKDSEGKNRTNFDPFFKIAKEKEKGIHEISDITNFKQIITYENKFLEKIEGDIRAKNWCNIEKLYFDELVRCYEKYKTRKDRNDTSQIDKLNRDFDGIENGLRQYLEEEVRKEYKNEENEIIRKPLIRGNAVNPDFLSGLQDEFEKEIWRKDVNEYLILTCNYTKTVELYKNRIEAKGKKVEVIYIHGQLEADIIFGYGDEYCEESKEIEKLDENKFQQKVKQIKYAETSDYMTFDKFITNGIYDVVVLGHSCGNTDRTLLRRLLEMGNCKTIIPYFYDDKDKEEKKYNIYRIFDDKQKFQERIIPVKQWRLIPCIDRLNKSPLALLLESSFKKIERPTTSKYKLLDNNTEKDIKQNFFIGKYQVTQQQWQEIMGNNPSYFQANGANKPVEQVSWYDCVEFCNKLSEKYNLEKYYNITKNDVKFNVVANGFRLPTEAEWEYAAKGGDKSKNHPYSGSNHIDDVAWYTENSDSSTHEVGTKQPNELGIHDMSGNVWEWCEDEYSKRSSYRVLRGGGWSDGAQGCRVSDRLIYSPDNRGNFIGFRLALVLS